MRKLKELPIGSKFNLLTIIEDAGYKQLKTKKERVVKCVCDCGVEGVFYFSFVRNGHTKSCGCIAQGNKYRSIVDKHPDFKSIYERWSGMVKRCHNPKCHIYKYYGGRGIFVCDEWINDFVSFYYWTINNGYEHSLQLDREDNDKGYSPGNCRWVTKTVNARNTRFNRIVRYNGESKTLAEWGEITGISVDAIRSRIDRGWGEADYFLPSNQIRRCNGKRERS